MTRAAGSRLREWNARSARSAGGATGTRRRGSVWRARCGSARSRASCGTACVRVVSEPVPSQRALLVALAGAGVRFVVIGGHAVAAHGYERATRDVDIVFSPDAASCERLAQLLVGLDAKVRIADLPAPGGAITGGWLAGGGHFVFSTVHGLLDALTWIAGLDYAALESRALTAELADGTQIAVCGYDDLVMMKRIADRPRDREDLRELALLRD
jgi:hypothetical protein